MTIANVGANVQPAVAQTEARVVDTRPVETATVRQPVADAATTAAPKATPAEIRDATETLSQYIDVASRSLNIRVDSELREPVVTVLDSETEEIIRQIPSEELLSIAKFLKQQSAASATDDALAGVLLREAT